MCIYTICGPFLQQKTAAIRNILFYAWYIFIAKDHRYPKYFIQYVVYFYGERLPLCSEA